MINRLLFIFLGGGVGSICRYLLGGWVQKLSGPAFPAGTLACNIIGCIVIGFLATILTGPIAIRPEYRLGILVGLLGGFTTFSSFGYETLNLARDSQFLFAAINILVSNIAGLAAAWLGVRVATALYGAA